MRSERRTSNDCFASPPNDTVSLAKISTNVNHRIREVTIFFFKLVGRVRTFSENVPFQAVVLVAIV